VVSTGVPFLIVPLRDRQTLASLRPLASIPEPVYCFALGGEQATTTARCRMFAPGMGIVEDAATGSAAGPLAAYLVRHGLATPPFEFEQGYEMGRPSRLFVDIHDTEVWVGGHAVILGGGRLDLPAGGR